MKLIPCSYCPKMVERDSNRKVATCFSCKKYMKYARILRKALGKKPKVKARKVAVKKPRLTVEEWSEMSANEKGLGMDNLRKI